MTEYDARRQNQAPIAARDFDLVLAHGPNPTTIESALNINGTVMSLFVVVPNLTGVGGCTVYLVTSEGREFWNSGNIAESATHHLQPGISLIDSDKIKIVTVDNQVADMTFGIESRHA